MIFKGQGEGIIITPEQRLPIVCSPGGNNIYKFLVQLYIPLNNVYILQHSHS